MLAIFTTIQRHFDRSLESQNQGITQAKILMDNEGNEPQITLREIIFELGSLGINDVFSVISDGRMR